MWAREGERDSRKWRLTLGLWPEPLDAITGGEKTGRSVFGGGRARSSVLAVKFQRPFTYSSREVKWARETDVCRPEQSLEARDGN